MADLAYVFHWSLSELDEMTIDELQAWHDQAARLNQRANEA